MARRVVVVGGGLAGLVVGRALTANPALDVTVLETERRPGGKALTEVESVPTSGGSWLLEWGAQTLLVEPASALARAISAADLCSDVLQARAESRRRLVLWEGALRPVPRSLSRIVGIGGAMRAFAEPFVGGAAPDGDESVLAFATRRFGERVASRLVGAFVTGIFAGDPARLSVRSAFPRLVALERAHGSVVRGALRGGGPKRDTLTLRLGTGSLTDGLARRLGPALRLGTPAIELVRTSPGPTWRVETPGGSLPADAVVLAAPAFAASYLLRPTDAPLADALGAIPYVPVAAVCLGYREEAFAKGPPQGFGFLVPRGQARVLGCLFPTSIAACASPPGHVLLRVLVGGALDPEGAALPEGELVELCRREVEPLVGAGEAPVLTRVFRHTRAIPQYELGHADRLAAIEARRAALPGLFLTGNAYRGVSLGDVCEDAERVAGEVLRSLT